MGVFEKPRATAIGAANRGRRVHSFLNGMQSLVVDVVFARVFEHILVGLAGVIYIRTAR